MQIKLLKDVVSLIAGPSAVGIVDLLHGKKNVNEFLIAKKLNINVNQARNILYKLSERGLVSFMRKKDKKNGGWYTYYWTLDVSKSLESLKNVILESIENLESQLKSRETKRFYHCEICELEMSEESALGYDFTCPECGEVLSLKDNSKAIEHLTAELENLRKDLVVLDEELGKVYKKETAAKTRRQKAEQKKKKEKAAAARKARAKASQAASKKGKSGKASKVTKPSKSSKKTKPARKTKKLVKSKSVSARAKKTSKPKKASAKSKKSPKAKKKVASKRAKTKPVRKTRKKR